MHRIWLVVVTSVSKLIYLWMDFEGITPRLLCMVARCLLTLKVANVVINIILILSTINSSPRLGVLDRVCIATDVVQRIPVGHPCYQLVEAKVCVCLCFLLILVLVKKGGIYYWCYHNPHVH